MCTHGVPTLHSLRSTVPSMPLSPRAEEVLSSYVEGWGCRGPRSLSAACEAPEQPGAGGLPGLTEVSPPPRPSFKVSQNKAVSRVPSPPNTFPPAKRVPCPCLLHRVALSVQATCSHPSSHLLAEQPWASHLTSVSPAVPWRWGPDRSCPQPGGWGDPGEEPMSRAWKEGKGQARGRGERDSSQA